MSIEDQGVVDFVSIDNSDRVILTISDHLPWSSVARHLEILENKLEVYDQFVSSGQLLEQFPKAIGKKVVVEVMFHCKPVDEANSLLKGLQADFQARSTIDLIFRDFSTPAYPV